MTTPWQIQTQLHSRPVSLGSAKPVATRAFASTPNVLDPGPIGSSLSDDFLPSAHGVLSPPVSDHLDTGRSDDVQNLFAGFANGDR